MDPTHSRPIAISSYIPPEDPAAYPILLVRQPSLTKHSSRASSPEHIVKERSGRSRRGVLKALWKKWKEQKNEEGTTKGERKKLIFGEDANTGESSERISAAKRTDSAVDERMLPILGSRSENNLLRQLTQPRSNAMQSNISDATEGNPAEVRRARMTKSNFIERQEMEPRQNKIDNTPPQIPYPKPDYSLFEPPFTGVSPYVISNDVYIPMPHARREFLDPRVEVREFWPVDARYDGRVMGRGTRGEERREEEADFEQNNEILDSHANIQSHARAVEGDFLVSRMRYLASNLDNQAHSYDGLPPRRYSNLDLQSRGSKSEPDEQGTHAGLLPPLSKHYSLTTSFASDSTLALPNLSSNLTSPRSSAQSYDAHDSDQDYLVSSPARNFLEPKTLSPDFKEDTRAQRRIQLLRALVVPRRVGPMEGKKLEEGRKAKDGSNVLGWGMDDPSVEMGDRRDVRRPV